MQKKIISRDYYLAFLKFTYLIQCCSTADEATEIARTKLSRGEQKILGYDFEVEA